MYAAGARRVPKAKRPPANSVSALSSSGCMHLRSNFSTSPADSSVFFLIRGFTVVDLFVFTEGCERDSVFQAKGDSVVFLIC